MRPHVLTLLPLLALVACPTAFPTRDFPDDPAHDFDGDGLTETQGDCDDRHPTIRPGAPEICDQADNDCDGLADNDPTDPTAWYRDSDGDLYGDDTVVTSACTAPTGFVARSGDCDDGKSLVHPGVNETCTDFDDNCDGDLQVPEGTDAPVWYLDRDGDNFGDVSVPSVPSCEAPAGYVYDASDCDDLRADVRPRAVEVCDGVDNDCDGAADDADSDALGLGDWFHDADGDGYGDPVFRTEACAAPEGYVAEGDDCDDTSADVSPGATELCDGLDQDCDGRVDDGVTTQFHVDLDGDGYGDPDGASIDACAAPSGFTDDATDCDDSDPVSHPDASEVCDGADNDCDGRTDESGALGAATWYADADGDAYGDRATTFAACTAPPSYVATTGDCDDGRADVNPDARESCLTAFDDDCDGSDNDPGAVGCLDFWNDADGDGYGNAAGTASCQCRADATTGFNARDDDDCDDDNASVNPDELEDCTTRDDDDCSGTTNDDGAAFCDYFFVDVDGDGYGDDALHDDASCTCEGEGYLTATVEGDCLDTDARVSPTATEICGGGDEDCSGAVDDDAIDARTWYRDSDTDTYGNASVSRVACTAPSGYIARASDCDDARDGVNPGQRETCLTLFDDDCSGSTNDRASLSCTTFYADADSDGYGVSSDSVCTCSADLATVYTSRVTGDCLDTNAGVSPADAELCSTAGVDDDCDGTADEQNAAGCRSYFYDYDGDGYGTATSQCLCSPVGYYTASTLGDCNDSNLSVNPAARNCGLNGPVTPSDASAIITGRQTYVGYQYGSVASLDYNRDGLVDVVVGSPGENGSRFTGSGAVYLWLSRAGGMIGTHAANASGDASMRFVPDDGLYAQCGADVTTGDVDGDGYAEILVSCDFGARSYLLDDGLEGLGTVTAGTSGVYSIPYRHAVMLGDVNDDGRDDALVMASDDTTTAYLAWGQTSGGLTVSSSTVSLSFWKTSAYGSYRAAASGGDIDGDGVTDVVVQYRGSVVVYEGSSVFDTGADASASAGIGCGNYASAQAIGDINGDGRDDVAIGCADAGYGDVRVFGGGIGSGTGGLALVGASASAAPSSSNIAFGIRGASLGTGMTSAGDVDGDGTTDFLVTGASSTTGSVGAVLMYGPVSFDGAIYSPSAADATITGVYMGVGAAGDINSDGYDDIWAGASSLYLFHGTPR